ncbi:MAG: serine kinase [Erythrobacter sp.]|nr:serine kinase [Erythrobacter sp.]
MHRYRAFGLTIGSDVRLDELAPQPDEGAPVDLRIVRSDLGETIPPLGHHTRFDFEGPNGVEMMWPGAASIRIENSSLVHIQAFEGAPENYLAFPLLGPVMGWMLHMRGLFVLHASAARRDGRSVAFLGDKTAGKSTTASAFLKHGWALMTDDLLAIDCEGEGQPQIQPAFAQMKLNADAPNADIPHATILPLVMEGFEKRQYRLPALAQEPADTDCIFILQRGGDHPRIEWLSATDAIEPLFRYSYNIRFTHAPLAMQDRARQFRQAARIADTTRIGRLHIPHDRDRLGETVAMVEAMLSGEGK